MSVTDEKQPDVNVEGDVNVIDTPEEAIPVLVTEAKKGYRTTEFWVTVVTALLLAFNGIPMPESIEGFAIAGLAGIYAVSRGLAKKDETIATVLPPSA